MSYRLQIWYAALYLECLAVAQNFPESWRGLGYVTPIIFGIRSNISLKLLELRDFKFDTRLCMGNAEQAHK